MPEASAALLHYGWLSLLPALTVFALALWSKRIVEPLLMGVATAAFIIDWHVSGLIHSLVYFIPNAFITLAGHPATETLKGVGIVKDSGRGQLLISVALLGSLMTLIEKSGGTQAFSRLVTRRIQTQSAAMLTSFGIGLSVFTSAYFSILINGAAMRPIFDKLKLSREKLAFFCDATSAPVKALIPLSGWIGFMTVLIEQNIPSVAEGQGLEGFMRTIPYNLYCWAILVFSVALALKIIPDFGAMRRAERRVKTQGLLHEPGGTPMIDPKAEEQAAREGAGGSVCDMTAPLGASVLCLLVLGMWNGFYVKWFPGMPLLGIKSLEILSLAFACGVVVAAVKYAVKGLMPLGKALDAAFDGAKSTMIGCVIIMLAVTMGDLMGATAPEGLGTAPYIAQSTKAFLVRSWLPALTFLVSAGMSFAMGSSWGVWSIMMPISVPIALGFGIDPFLVAGAVLSGGAFGDHCSPISDTSVLSSLAANTDHMQHIQTQLPYALAAAGAALAGYVVLGLSSL